MRNGRRRQFASQYLARLDEELRWALDLAAHVFRGIKVRGRKNFPQHGFHFEIVRPQTRCHRIHQRWRRVVVNEIPAKFFADELSARGLLCQNIDDVITAEVASPAEECFRAVVVLPSVQIEIVAW